MDTREFCEENGIFLKKLEWVGNAGKDWGPGANAWKVTLGHGRRSITVDFHTGSAWKKDEIDAATVLDSLKLDAQSAEQYGSDVEEFASDLGYDVETRSEYARIRSILTKCRALARKLERFLGDELYQELLWEVEGL